MTLGALVKKRGRQAPGSPPARHWRYMSTMTQALIRALIVVAAVSHGTWVNGQTVISPLESAGPISVTPIGEKIPREVPIPCENFHGSSWTRVSADSAIVISAAPFIAKDTSGRAVAYFTNGHGDLLVCIDSGSRSACGDRHVIYKALDDKWIRNQLEVEIIC